MPLRDIAQTAQQQSHVPSAFRHRDSGYETMDELFDDGTVKAYANNDTELRAECITGASKDTSNDECQ
ncbi:hypothetical protein LTR66_015919, partial [Elasticomyces elasticus]